MPNNRAISSSVTGCPARSLRRNRVAERLDDRIEWLERLFDFTEHLAGESVEEFTQAEFDIVDGNRIGQIGNLGFAAGLGWFLVSRAGGYSSGLGEIESPIEIQVATDRRKGSLHRTVRFLL